MCFVTYFFNIVTAVGAALSRSGTLYHICNQEIIWLNIFHVINNTIKLKRSELTLTEILRVKNFASTKIRTYDLPTLHFSSSVQASRSLTSFCLAPTGSQGSRGPSSANKHNLWSPDNKPRVCTIRQSGRQTAWLTSLGYRAWLLLTLTSICYFALLHLYQPELFWWATTAARETHTWEFSDILLVKDKQ